MTDFLKDLWHTLTHGHTILAKPGLCEIQLCYRRVRAKKINVHIEFHDPGWMDLSITGVTPAQLSTLFDADTHPELNRRAVDLINGRTPT